MKKYITIILGALLFISCDDFLDIRPTGMIIAETGAEYRALLTDVYSRFPDDRGKTTFLSDEMTSDAKYIKEKEDKYIDSYGSYFDIWSWADYNRGELGSLFEWRGYYHSCYIANYIIEHKDEITKASQKEIDQLVGECYMMRAYIHFLLVNLYAPAYPHCEPATTRGIPLSVKADVNAVLKCSSVEQVYKQILDDIDSAEKLMNVERWDEGLSYRFNTTTAHALRARVALYMGDWQTAVEYSTKLISRTDRFELSLASYTVTSDGMNEVDYLWHYDSGYEVIWRIGYTSTSYGGALGQNFLSFNNDYTYYYPDYVPAQSALSLYKSGDARYNAYFAELSTGYSHQLSWPLLIKYYGNRELLSLYIYHVNMPKPIRLAEQYLIRAEAYCNLGKFGPATTDISTLRNSRYSNKGGTLSVSEDNWMQVIDEERVRELYMEGFRLNDLKRWGKGFERTPQASVQAEGSKLKVEPNNPRFVWPIPKHEIEAPGSEVVGNASNNL